MNIFPTQQIFECFVYAEERRQAMEAMKTDLQGDQNVGTKEVF